MENQDLRSYPRAQTRIEIVYFKDNQVEKIKGETKDLSATGISFNTEQVFAMGEMLNIELNLVDLQKTILTRAIVIRNWTEENQNYVSVHFFDIDYNDFIVLLDLSLACQIET